jgi:hypothetical protein
MTVVRISARFILISGLSLEPSLGLSEAREACFRSSVGVPRDSGVSWSWESN